MKEKNLIALIKELYQTDELHTEYQDNDIQFVIDSQKDGNKLVFTVEVKDNEDKKQFESWVDTMPDELFKEVWESLYEIDPTLAKVYEGKNYKQVISKFKDKTKEVVNNKIHELQKLIDGQ